MCLTSDSASIQYLTHDDMKRIKTCTALSLKEWRQMRGLSQREAAKKLGLSQSMYARAELGRVHPRPQRAKAISIKTGVSFESLMGVA